MADFIRVDYDLTVHRAEDRSGDEPRLQFAFIENGPDGVDATIVDTGRLANNFPARRAFAAGTITLSDKHVFVPFDPTPDHPFMGMAVRALEEDNSSNSDRAADADALETLLEEGLAPIFAAGGTPSAEEIWAIANSAPVHDNFGDDDDRIGVSARVYPNIGVDLAGAPDGEPFIGVDTLSFVEDGAHWDLSFQFVGDSI